MDPEQTFLRVHARLSGMLAQLLSPKLRTLLEHLCLLMAIVLLGSLAVMHVNFVGQPGCAELFVNKDAAEAQLLQIKITGYGLWLSQKSNRFELVDSYVATQSDSVEMLPITEVNGDALSYWGKFWMNLFVFNTRRNKAGKWILKNDKGRDLHVDVKDVSESVTYKPVGRQTDVENGGTEAGSLYYAEVFKGFLEASVLRLWDKWTTSCAAFKKRINQINRSFLKLFKYAGNEDYFESSEASPKAVWNSWDSMLVRWLEKRSEAFEPVYVYSVEKGYLILPEAAKAHHNIRTMNISISGRNLCFGNRWQQLLINSFVGYDTILMNSLLHARGEGYLYNFQTKELYDLNYLHESSGAPNSFEGYIVSKCGVLIMSLFVFFTTTMSVSFTLRETQSRMLKFTVQLQYHARHRLPTFRLIFIHVIESLVFVPIMIGILFFLFEFYDDQMLAFMVLTVVWLCELFTMISVRTPMSMQYFPRFFLLYFIVFHIYFFSHEYGFSYLAFSATAAFMQHLVLYFWNHFEVPALQRFLSARALFQQQPAVHITSSAIITSTFHLTRVRPSTLAATQPESSIPGIGTLPNDVMMGITHPGSMRFMGDSPGAVHQNTTNSIPHGLGNPGLSTTGSTQAGGDHPLANGRDFSTSPSINRVSRPLDGNQTVNHVNGVNNAEASGSQEPHGPIQPVDSTTPSSLGHPNPLNSFGSILLWILGGPSETLVSYLPIFRDLRDHGSIQVSQDGLSQMSGSAASGVTEGLRHRHPHPTQDSGVN